MMKNILKSIGLSSLVVLAVLFLCSFVPQTKNIEQTNSLHPFHMSVFEINHNEKTKAIEITCKIISEDLESILRTKNGVAVDLAAVKDQEKNEKMINTYIQANLSLKLDGNPAVMKMVGYEKEKESVYAYFEIANVPSVKKIEVKNAVLFDLSTDQANIVHVVVGGKRQSKKLNYPEQGLTFDF
jgi:hypothetical protein